MSDLFNQIREIWAGSNKITINTKPESIYMATRFISLDEGGFFSATELNRMGSMPEWFGLMHLKHTTPNISAPRTKYPKKVAGKKLTPKDKKALLRICTKFNVTEFHGMQIKHLLEEQGFSFKEN